MSDLGKPTPVVVVQQKGTNHILHLLLTIFTGGLWAPVWLIVAIVNARQIPAGGKPLEANPMLFRAGIALAVIVIIFVLAKVSGAMG